MCKQKQKVENIFISLDTAIIHVLYTKIIYTVYIGRNIKSHLSLFVHSSCCS